ncbi:hypothetical protein Gpo141_00004512 [Globisporangium polare]
MTASQEQDRDVKPSPPIGVAAQVSPCEATAVSTRLLQSPSYSQRHHNHRPSTSRHMIHGGHTSHAMILQIQEYRERVQSACQSTYQFPLQHPHKPPLTADGKKRKAHKGYCRSHVLATTKQFFHAREPTPSHFSVPVDLKDRILPKKGGDVYINFHQMKPRKDEFLFGDHGNTRPKIAHDGNSAVGIAKDHFALGPGQYDVANIRPKTTTSVKFSPSDRFHENFSSDKLGPGQYITNEELTTSRAAVAVFSQTPRRTEAALLVSPTSNVVSSYYYVPESSFLDKNAPENDSPSWPRSPRLASQRRTTASIQAQQHRMAQATTDYVTKNKSHVGTQSAVQRLRKARELQGRLQLKNKRGESGNDDEHGYESDQLHMAPPPAFKRRSSIFLDIGSTMPPAAHENLAELVAVSGLFAPSRSVTSLTQKPSSNNGAAAVSAFSQLVQESTKFDKSLRGWVTLACIASFSVRMSKVFCLMRIIRQIQEKERQQLTLVVFSEWKKLDRARSLQYSTQLIMRNCFLWRLHVRVKRKCAHVSILRKFLNGLSIDVQFAIAMKKIKRKIQLIQRWWRHVQLMVKAREEALYYKWINVETRLRLEYINQIPHLQRIFQQPSSAANGSNATTGGGAPGSASQTNNSSNGDLTLQKLLNLPEQKKWSTARFVLTSDGCLRGYSSSDTAATGGDVKEALVVEVKNYRCNFHESVLSSSDGGSNGELVSTHLFDSNNSSSTTELTMSSSSLQAYQNYSSARWKPFLMVFRQGAFRFVLLTSTSPMPTEILSWKEKLERLVMAPASNGGVFGSISGASSGALSTSGSSSEGPSGHSSLHHNGGSGNFSTVSEFVEVSMQSGILSTNSHHHAPPLGALHGGSGSGSFGGSISLSATTSLQLATALAGGGGGGSSRNLPTQQPRGKLQARVRSIRQRNRMGLTVSESELTYYVVDLLKDFPKVPAAIVWQTIRDKLREKRKSFRAEIYRYNLEMYHFHRHQEQTKHIHVLDKFKEFFTLERPKRPHFRSLISNRKMEAMIRQTIEQLKSTMPSNPKYLLDASKPLS